MTIGKAAFLLLAAFVAPAAIEAQEVRDQIRFDNKGNITAVRFQNVHIALGRKMSEMPNVFPRDLGRAKTFVRGLGNSFEHWYFTFDQTPDRRLVFIWVLSGY